MTRDRRGVLFVHAHPDDETISTGGTIATLVDAGVAVTVLNCTRGERGEVIPPELESLEGDGPALGDHRTRELAEAMRVLGVTDQRFLGDENARRPGLAPRHYLDSGMVWGELGPEPVPDQHAESLCAAPFDEVVEDVAAVVAAVLPHAVVSYDAQGGYGHPDHIRAHHAARVAAEHLGVPFYTIEELAADAPADDALHLVDVGAVLERKTEAMRAHRTQLTVHGDTFSLSSGPRRPIASVEAFRRWESAGQPEEPSFGSAPLGSRVFASVLALVLGLAVGALGTVTHQVEVALVAVAIPVGVALALAVAGCLLLGLRLVFGSRTPALLASAGLVVTLIVLGQAGPGGSVLIPANIAGYVWTYGVPLFAAVVLAWPRLRTLSGSRGAGG